MLHGQVERGGTASAISGQTQCTPGCGFSTGILVAPQLKFLLRTVHQPAQPLPRPAAILAVTPDAPGTGLSEATAIAMGRNQVEEMDKAHFAINNATDSQPVGDRSFMTFQAGDQCDMKGHQLLTQ